MIRFEADREMAFWPTPPEVASDVVCWPLIPGYGDGAAGIGSRRRPGSGRPGSCRVAGVGPAPRRAPQQARPVVEEVRAEYGIGAGGPVVLSVFAATAGAER